MLMPEPMLPPARDGVTPTQAPMKTTAWPLAQCSERSESVRLKQNLPWEKPAPAPTTPLISMEPGPAIVWHWTLAFEQPKSLALAKPVQARPKARSPIIRVCSFMVSRGANERANAAQTGPILNDGYP